ncbi:MAG: VapC toxin family PIN domain ribonuclease [Ramlibacter sp.]|nr:VapC toxin family PIN domain ribonuclease [Ramlibacter sp.]
MRALLDVNVLIALHDRDHVHHERAGQWFASNIGYGWASCPLTQNGCLRVMSQAGYSNPQPLAALVAMLHHSVQTEFHTLWTDDISILDPARFNHSHIHSARQLTDLYLLGLAVENRGRLVSFDLRIPISAVRGATAANMVTL